MNANSANFYSYLDDPPDEPTGKCDLSPEAALWALAERLYWNLDRLDPDIAAPEWGGLTEREKRLYYLLVGDLVKFDGLIQCAQAAGS
jgi:hypothetical protein